MSKLRLDQPHKAVKKNRGICPSPCNLLDWFYLESGHPYCGHSVILGKRSCTWQNAEYVQRLFGDLAGNARRLYSAFIRQGVALGKKPDLIGGGLLRSQGGWEAVKAQRQTGSYQKGDERKLSSPE